MSMNRNFGFALLLIALGAFILLNGFGLLGYLMGFIIPIIMIVLGFYGAKNGSKIAWFFIILGGIILFVKLTPFFVTLMAIAFIVYGISMLTRRSRV